MQLRLFFLVLFLGVLTSVNAQVPDFQLPDVDGNTISFSDIKGAKVTLIDFWATWCQPCVRSIPKLIEISKEYSGKGVQVIGINVDSPRNTSKVRPFVASKGIIYPVLLDSNGELMSMLGLTALPTLLIVDRNNKIVSTRAGFLPGEEKDIRKQIDSLIAE